MINRSRPFLRRTLRAVLLSTVLAAIAVLSESAIAATSEGAKPLVQFTEPTPLDSKVVEMMKTNSLGSVEARIYFVEKWAIAPIQKAQVFLSMLASADADDQRKLAHAAVPHVPNTNYTLVRSHLLDPKLPREVLSVFMTDTLKRPYNIKLPVLLSLAQVATHPMQTEAQELLRGYLGRDHGTNWMKWEETIIAWLKTNPR